MRAGKTITTSASVYINPADAKHFPIFAWLAFYFNAWGETVEAILLVADFPFFIADLQICINLSELVEIVWFVC